MIGKKEVTDLIGNLEIFHLIKSISFLTDQKVESTLILMSFFLVKKMILILFPSVQVTDPGLKT